MTPARRRLLLAVCFSVAVHLPVVYLSALGLMQSPASESEAGFFEVLPLLREDVDDPRHPTEEQREEDEEYEPPEDLPAGQVVNAEEAGEERAPEDAELLSDRDQVVESQRQARFRSRGEAVASRRPLAPFSQGESRPEADEQEQPMLAGLLVRDRTPLRPTPEGEHAPEVRPPPSTPSPLNLNPSIAAMSDAVGGTGLDDLGDVEEGDRSLLTTARWLHAPFFQRVKHQVEQYWHPDEAFRRFDPGGHVYGYRDRETVVRVVLDGTGALVRAYVIRASGAAFLDEEAVQAIEQAAPFPNPPRGLIDEATNRIVFTFGFTVELGERPIFRLRRYR